ncbi:hypothetical protein JX265_013732 [Neoarthrinium moseri]|uniref:Uncharacterized protein n=1 Tax=Neoarthrinium moseri TaxID=1658444 RepID=A0A9P9W869_9PEZI|nr:hypothetical protein JX266_011370 [Neoarthrinium moseri]KAI1848989.1 hypothetical protein JX265_013732 [Neoarthrinium moseri]
MPATDLNPARRPMRLYLKVEKALEISIQKLERNAWSCLSEKDKQTVLIAVRREMKRIIDRDMDQYPTRTPIDYSTIVEDGIRIAFEQNLSLFNWVYSGCEDDSLVSELMDESFDQ